MTAAAAVAVDMVEVVMTPTGTVAPTGVTIAGTIVDTVRIVEDTTVVMTEATIDLRRIAATVTSVLTIAETATMVMAVAVLIGMVVVAERVAEMIASATDLAVAMTAVPQATSAIVTSALLTARGPGDLATPLLLHPPMAIPLLAANLGTSRCINPLFHCTNQGKSPFLRPSPTVG